MQKLLGGRIGFIIFVTVCFIVMMIHFQMYLFPATTDDFSKQAIIEGRFEMEYELTKDPATGEVPRQKLLKAWKYTTQQLNQRSTTNMLWEERGPNNVGGRTRAILIDANDTTHKTVWAGGVAGGLWKTTNISATAPNWSKVSGIMDNLSVSAIAQDPNNPNTMYLGTGEGWQNSDAVRGLGIFKSVDGGATWIQLPATNNPTFYYTQKIIINDLGDVFAATRAGLQVSTDGGLTWSPVLGNVVGLGSHDLIADLEIASNGDLYATMGIHAKGFIWKSSYDIHGPQTGHLGTWENISPSGNYRRTEIAIAPSNPNYLYAICQSHTTGAVDFFYQSTDGGVTWTNKSIAAWGTQTWYNLILAVDPNDPNRVHAGGTPAYISNDGGSTWLLSYFGVHVDFHNIQFLHSASNEIVCATDGGIYYSNNADVGNPAFQSKNNGYNVTQFYSCAIHPDPNRSLLLAGSQDNGTQKMEGEGIQNGLLVTGGDGGFCHIDQNDPQYVFSSFFLNNLNRSVDGGNTFAPVIFDNTGSFINASDYDDVHQILYAGSNTNQYFRWNDPRTGNSSDKVTVSAFSNAKVTHVLVSPNIPNRIYFGLNNGAIVYVDDAHGGVSKSGRILKTGIGSVSGIAIEKGNEAHIVATYTNYGTVSVWETESAMSATPSWENVEGNLPDMPVRWCVISPKNNKSAIIATELGIWSTDSLAGAQTIWHPANGGLANVRVDMLQFRASDSLLVAATHGRGLFTSNYFSPLTIKLDKTSTSISENDANILQHNCKKHTQVVIPVTLSRKPENSLVVHIAINSNTTAASGKDYSLDTDSLIFNASDPLTKNIELKIYDDGVTETIEKIELAISTNHNSAIIEENKHVLQIVDEDPNPITGKVSHNVIIGTGNFNFNFGPFRGISEDMRMEMIVLKSELAAQNMSASNISALAFDVKEKGSFFPYQDFTIAMKNSVDAATDYEFESEMTTVFSQTISTNLGWNEMVFQQPFYWDGHENLIIQTCYDNEQSSSNDVVNGSFLNFNGTEFYFQNNTNGCQLSQPASGFTVRPNLRLTMEKQIEVDTTLSVSAEIWLNDNETTHFYNENKEIIASIHPSQGNSGCYQVAIDAVGVHQMTPTWLGYPVSEKQFYIQTEENANYELTLYFTEAELACWDAAKMNLNILRSSEAIAQANQINTTVFPAANVLLHQNSTPNKLIYQGNFTGSSGLALTNAPISILPLEFVNFQGAIQEEGHYLTWQTAKETDLTNFSLERSANGQNFYELDKVLAKGISNNDEYYQYLDNHPLSGKNYYRLSAIDHNGTATILKTILLTNSFHNSFKAYPSLLRDDLLQLEYKSYNNGIGTFSIFDLKGNAIHQEQLYFIKGINNFKYTAGLPKGIFILLLEVGSKNHQIKVFKQ